MIDGRLREVWEALGCAPNPDDFKEEVQTSMWREAVKLIREQSAGVTRVHLENAELRALLDRPAPTVDEVYQTIREANTPNGGYSFEVAATKVMALYDRGRIPFNQTVGNEQT